MSGSSEPSTLNNIDVKIQPLDKAHLSPNQMESIEIIIANTVNIKGGHKSILQTKQVVTKQNESTKGMCNPSPMLDSIKEKKRCLNRNMASEEKPWSS